MTLRSISSMLLLALCLGTTAPAKAQFNFGGNSDIYIVAEKATYKGRLTILEGDVKVRQGESQIHSDIMHIYREEAPKDSGASAPLGAVQRIEAMGNFKYSTPENTVIGTKGVYKRSTGLIVVTGNVKVRQESGNTATTDRLTYNVKTETIRFEGDCLGKECQDRPTIRIK